MPALRSRLALHSSPTSRWAMGHRRGAGRRAPACSGRSHTSTGAACKPLRRARERSGVKGRPVVCTRRSFFRRVDPSFARGVRFSRWVDPSFARGVRFFRRADPLVRTSRSFFRRVDPRIWRKIRDFDGSTPRSHEAIAVEPGGEGREVARNSFFDGWTVPKKRISRSWQGATLRENEFDAFAKGRPSVKTKLDVAVRVDRTADMR